MHKEIEDAIKILSALDLSKCSDEEVAEQLHKFGDIVLFGLNIKAGQFIARTHCDEGLNVFYYEDKISYIKDKSKIPNYNRASLHGEPMFYGCIPKGGADSEHECQVLSIAESSKIIERESEDEFEEYATMGKWRVIKDFNVVALAHHKDFISENPELKDMHEDYLKFIKRFPENEEDFIRIAEYLSSEFAKKVSNDKRYEYKISAAFTKILLSRGGHGVLYPTAKNKGKGYNIALAPSTVDACLQLEKVAAWRIQKRKKNVFIQPLLYCEKFQSDKKFIWQDPGISVPSWMVEKQLSAP